MASSPIPTRTTPPATKQPRLRSVVTAMICCPPAGQRGAGQRQPRAASSGPATTQEDGDGRADQGIGVMSALVTEHFVLQSAASTTISEASARASLYVFSLSSALVAIAVDRDSPRWRPPRLSENCRDDCVAAATALSQRRRLGLHRHLCGDFDPGRHRRRVGRWPSRAGRASCGGGARGEESGRVPRGAAHRPDARICVCA
jgi:hypothetical protein